MISFDPASLKNLFTPATNSNGEDNGQITIIGGSNLFHGAPLLTLSVASRFVDMVFFSSPEDALGEISAQMKSRLSSFIWVPLSEIESYIEKSDAVLIGPGLMRYHSENNRDAVDNGHCDEACEKTKKLTERLLKSFPQKHWVIDAGSLQTMSPDWIPEEAILTPNKKEYQFLFGQETPEKIAQKYNCTLVLKGLITYVYSPREVIEIKGGNPGLTKGGTGDVQAGLTVALLAKNDPQLAAAAAAFLVKAAADSLQKRVGVNFNADDLALEIPATLHRLLNP